MTDQPSARSDTNFVITNSKRHLQKSLNEAKLVSDPLLTTLGLAHMHNMFFLGMVGQQTEDSAKAMRGVVRESGNALWGSVVYGFVADMMEHAGRKEEAANWSQYGLNIVGQLPAKVQEALAAD